MNSEQSIQMAKLENIYEVAMDENLRQYVLYYRALMKHDSAQTEERHPNSNCRAAHGCKQTCGAVGLYFVWIWELFEIQEGSFRWLDARKSIPEEVFGVISLSRRSTGPDGNIPEVPYFLISRCAWCCFCIPGYGFLKVVRGRRRNFVNLDCEQELQINPSRPMSYPSQL
jgi:hypothetical protein